MDKVAVIIEGDFGGTEHGLDVFKVMDTFHRLGIEIHGFHDGIYEGIICEDN